ncbi:hypothetical protein [Cellulomonas composti]|uniref:Htaa domain-containing protein n=1 Tax=Cellulomonas composti TaxID=266130 RepID=A0A511JCA8_9CELL|nr:hypothetical protein [Cellulomonas composti]GEL95612.1 hypothetical protein CCO02nite_22700 [Cellulomonas composti]
MFGSREVRRRRRVTAVLTALIVVGAGLAASGPATGADKQPVTFGELTWGFLPALRADVTATPGGTITPGRGTRFDSTVPGTASTRPIVFRQDLFHDYADSSITGADLELDATAS